MGVFRKQTDIKKMGSVTLNIKINIMKKELGLFTSAVLVGGCLFLASCGEDEPPTATISFDSPTTIVNEADDVIEIEVKLNRPAETDFVITYSVDGTATDAEDAAANEPYDFEILEDLSDYGEINIAKGESSGVIQIQLYSDFDYEDSETIEISLESEDGKYAELTREDEIEITIEQEDGLAIVLEWNAAYNDVDMDLFLWAKNGANYELTGIASTNPATTPRFEFVFVPDVVDDGDFGISCNYYDGTANPMNFTVSYIKIVSGDDVSTIEKSGTYDLDNINAWDDYTAAENFRLLVAGTYTKTGSNYSNFSDILVTTNSTGSRSSNDQQLKNLSIQRGGKNLPFIKKR